MKHEEIFPISSDEFSSSRRNFIEKSIKIAAITSIAGIGILSSCKKEDEDKDVSPPEDLMQEHGLLNRVLLIYDNCHKHLNDGTQFPLQSLHNAAGVIKTFVEDYHEKQEENYLFPRFRKANKLTDLVKTLQEQHDAGRVITLQILELSKSEKLTENQSRKLIELLSSFNFMYRPHETREDTVLFPAFRKIVSQHEYDSLGEEFEKNEHKHFGDDGFEMMVDKVASIEKQLGIYELAQFTPMIL